MMESMVTADSGGNTYFPDSGPGSKFLVDGDKSIGYFGAVTTTELFTEQEIIYATREVTGARRALDGMVWHKHFYDGRVLYVLDRPMYDTTRNSLYSAGLIYGETGQGRFSITDTPVDQMTVLTKPMEDKDDAVWSLILRTLTADRIDPTVIEAGVNDGECFSTVLLGMANKWGYTATYPEVTANVSADNITIPVVFNASGLTTQSATATTRWRPVLELVPTDDMRVMPVHNASYDNDVLFTYLTAANEIPEGTVVAPTITSIAQGPVSSVLGSVHAEMVFNTITPVIGVAIRGKATTYFGTQVETEGESS